jgi:hypothetical protein
MNLTLNEKLRFQKQAGIINESQYKKLLKEDKSSKIKTFIIMNTDSDERESIDQQKEIDDIQKMVSFMGKGSFVKKIQSKYRRAERKKIEDLFDSIA